MMIIRVVKTAPGSVSMTVAPTPPPAPTIKKPDEGSSAKHRKRTRGDAVDDVCAKRRVKEPSWEWLYCWVTSVSDADEQWRAWMRAVFDEGKSVSASFCFHYCPVFASDNGHALSYSFGWEWTLYALPYFTFLPV